MNWISTNDRLPEEGKYVLARHSRGTWHDGSDQSNVNCVVVKLVRGISKLERQLMRSGEMPDPLFDPKSPISFNNPKRSYVETGSDEQGNNLLPYSWKQFGPDSFFGQDVSHWMPIEPLT